MRRGTAHVLAATAVASAIALVVAIPTSSAELDNAVYSSKAHKIRLVVPRGWRATDQPTYPGLLMWMLRDRPDGKIVLTAEPFTRAMYCSWPIECRQSTEPLPNKLACALRERLEAQRIRVGGPEAGPKENRQNGLPTVAFNIDDGKRYLRQAVAVTEDRVVTLTLQAPSLDARNLHERAFEQALRSLRPLTPEEQGVPAPSPQEVVLQLVDDAGVPATPGDAIATSDAAVATVATTFESAPVSKQEPVGPCGK